MKGGQSPKVVNIETEDWDPSQVARWLLRAIDAGEVGRVLVIIERPDDDEDGTLFRYMWSNSTRESLWYMLNWVWTRFQDRYFRGE